MTTINLQELYWAAGFIEGEGCFTGVLDKRGRNFFRATLVVSQKELEPLWRLSRIFGAAGMYRSKSGVTNWTINGKRAIGVMMTLWPLMSQRRRWQIEKVIAAWKGNRSHKQWSSTYKRSAAGRFA
jgi:LAGLIDADG endonuclease